MASSDVFSRTNLLLIAVATWVSLLALSPDPAQAAAPPSQDVQALIDKAQQDYVAERYDKALDGFLKAHKKSGFAGLLFPIARCHEALGQHQKAADAYQEFIEKGDAPDDVRGKAEMAMRLLMERLEVGTLVLQVSPFGADVAVDGKPVGMAPVEPLKLKPGSHEVSVQAEGFTRSKQVVEVLGANTATIVIVLDRTVAETPVGPVSPKEPTVVKKSDDSASTLSPWTWVTLGAGLATAVSGGVVYWLGEQDHMKITEAEGYGNGELVGMTRAEALDLEASGDAKKTTGTILLAVGGAVIVTSAVLFLLDGSGDEDKPSSDLTGGISVGNGGAALTVGGRF